jgi:hypothetical protein
VSTIAEIMDEIADVLRDTLAPVLAVEDLAVQVEPRLILNPTALSVDVYPADPFSDVSGGGFGNPTGRYVLTVRARTNTPDSPAAQDLLLALMDDEDDLSVIAALWDETLNGMVASLHIEGPSGYTQYVDPGGQGALLGCEWRVSVHKARS